MAKDKKQLPKKLCNFLEKTTYAGAGLAERKNHSEYIAQQNYLFAYGMNDEIDFCDGRDFPDLGIGSLEELVRAAYEYGMAEGAKKAKRDAKNDSKKN